MDNPFIKVEGVTIKLEEIPFVNEYENDSVFPISDDPLGISDDQIDGEIDDLSSVQYLNHEFGEVKCEPIINPDLDFESQNQIWLPKIINTTSVAENPLSTDSLSPTRNSKRIPSLFKCNLCPKTLPTQWDLENHCATVHTVAKPFMCPICSKEYSFARHYYVHLQKHSSEPDLKGKPPPPPSTSNNVKVKPAPQSTTVDLDSDSTTSTSLSTSQNFKSGKIYKCELCPNGVYNDCESLLAHTLKVHVQDTDEFRQDKKILLPDSPPMSIQIDSVSSWSSTAESSRSAFAPMQNPFEFQCHLCPSSFERNVSLRAHITQSHTRKSNANKLLPFKCSQCPRSYTRPNALRHHEKGHSNFRPFVCDICPKGFIRNCDLVAHKQTHSEVKKYLCPEDDCFSSFSSSTGLKLHRAKVHGAETPFKCQICGLGFVVESFLNQHLVTHTNDTTNEAGIPNRTTFKCLICRKAFNTSKSAKIHEKLAHRQRTSTGSLPPEEKPAINRNYCESTVDNIDEEIRRSAELVINRKTKGNVQVTNLDFSQKSMDLDQHPEDVQTSGVEDDEFQEDEASIHSEHDHEASSSEPTKLPFQCKLCPASFERAASLTAHINQGHTRRLNKSKGKPFKCPLCPKYCSTKAALYYHKQSHSNVRAFNCNLCGKSFLRNTDLTRHKWIHNAVKKYVCSKEDCGKSFSSNVGLKFHDVKYHGGHKPYKCEFCGSSFVLQCMLDQHLAKKHPNKMSKSNNLNENSLNQFKCTICTRYFKSSRAAKIHEKRGHRQQTSPSADFESNIDEEIRRNAALLMSSRKLEGNKPDNSDDGHGLEEFIDENSNDELVDENPVENSSAASPSLKSSKIYQNFPSTSMQKLPFRCKICPSSFERKVSLKCHITQAHTRKLLTIKKFKCPLCPRSYKSKPALFHHKQSHSDVRSYICNICGKSFLRNTDLTAHKWTHNAIKKYICTESDCAKSFSSFVGLKLHRAKYHEGEKPFKCQFCGMAFVLQGMLDRHSESCKVRDGISYDCKICEASFKSPRGLKIHQAHMHREGLGGGLNKSGSSNLNDVPKKEAKASLPSEKRPLSSEKSSKKKVVKHLLDFSGTSPSPYIQCDDQIDETSMKFQCKLCPSSFERHVSLRAHVTQAHTKKEFAKMRLPFKCSMCPKSYARKPALIHHENSHKGIRPHICDICGKGFLRNCDLTYHKYTHSSVKKYICSESDCCKSFGSYVQIKQHRAVAHGGDTPFKCRVCPKGFVTQGLLDNHLISHGGKSKRFDCEVCNRSFKSSKELKSHEVRAHGLDGNDGNSSDLDFEAYLNNSNNNKSSKTNKLIMFKCKVCHHFSSDEEKYLAIHYAEDHGLPVVALSVSSLDGV